MWTLGEPTSTERIPVEDKKTGDTRWVPINMHKIPMTYACKDGSVDECAITITKGRLCNFTWPDGAKEGSRDAKIFLAWFRERFGKELGGKLWDILADIHVIEIEVPE